MYCPHCSAWNEDDAKTCGYCHRDLTLDAPAGGVAANPPRPDLPAASSAPAAAPSAGAPLPSLPVRPFERPTGGMPSGALPTSPGMPSTYYKARPSPEHSVKATWSLALGLIGTTCFCIGALAGIPGLLLGFFAWRECQSDPDRWSGKGIAIAGMVTSVIAIVITLMMGIYYAAIYDQRGDNFLKEIIESVSPAASPGQAGAGTSPTAGAPSPYASDAAIMVQIIPAIESYREAHGAWPAWGAGPRGANGHASPYDPAYHMPTFRVWAAPAERGAFATLTTPIAYLFSFPPDPNAAVASGPATFGYFTNGEGWIVYSPGPDGVYDLDPQTMYPRGEWSDETMINLISLLYDPTNGAASRGDIIHMMEESGD